jgi:hypothetical protein
MFLFDESYKIELEISQKEFVDKLLKETEIRNDTTNDIIPNKKRQFIGKIDFNKFELVRNRNAFLKNFTTVGHISEEHNKTLINGRITGYKFLLIFVITYTLFCGCIWIGNLLINSSQKDLTIGFLIFFIIGIFNLIGVIRSLKADRNKFVEKFKEISLL